MQKRPANSSARMSEEWTWEFSNRAADGLRALDDVVSDEFRNPPDFAKPLTSVKPWQSLRIGDYRAIVRFDRENQRIQVGMVGHRSPIYDEFP